MEERDNIIPENSETLLINETRARFSSALWYEKIQEQNIILAGIGGIGSFVTFLLSRMNPISITIYDPDRVEAVNMSGQLYRITDIGEYKTNAINSIVRSYSGYYGINYLSERYDYNSLVGKIMICGFDNMEARALFFNKWLNYVNSLPENEKKECLFLDGRLAAEEFQVLCIKGDDEFNINRYKDEFLFSDEEAEETICSYKQTTFMANMIASVMVNLFVNFIANRCNPIIDRDVPFYTSYSAETMYYKTVE